MLDEFRCNLGKKESTQFVGAQNATVFDAV